MESSKKLYIALAVLAVLVGGLYVQNQRHTEEAASYSYEAKQAELPNVTIDEETRNAIDAIELSRSLEEDDKDKADGDAGATAEGPKREDITLTKKGEEEWDVTSPIQYQANASNVKSLLENLGKLKVAEQVSTTAADYDKWNLTEEKALHAVFKKGEEVVLDMFLGDNGSRGQMMRLAGTDGVFAIKGYSKYLYGRDLKGWREKKIFKFEDKEAVKVTVANENGTFAFERDGEKDWKGTHDGKPIADFKMSRVDDLLRAYKSLNASDFADGKKPEELGLDKPTATVTIEMKDEKAKYVVSVGDNSEGSSRWVKTNMGDQIYSISSWTADWATAEVSKFQDKKEEKKEDGKAADTEAKVTTPPAP